MFSELKKRAALLKLELNALYLAFRDPRTGPGPRIVLFITIGYALSPVDLIPDFIPVLGYIDDLLILPALIALSVRLLPADVLKDAREKAALNAREIKAPKAKIIIAAATAVIWAALVSLLAAAVLRKIRNG